MKRLTEDQGARVEKLATDEGTTCEGCGCARLRCGGGTPHPRSWADGLPMVRQRSPPSGGLPILHDPRRGEHRHLEASLMHPRAWKGFSRNLVSFAPLIGSSCWRC